MDVIDYGRSIPSKAAKVIDYAHGDCIGGINSKRVCLNSRQSGILTVGETSSTSSKPIPKYT